jgi:hypothetical protein
MFEHELIAFMASLQLSSCMNSVAAMIRRVLLFAAVGSLSHSFICSIAISFVEGSPKYVAKSLIASRPNVAKQRYARKDASRPVIQLTDRRVRRL